MPDQGSTEDRTTPINLRIRLTDQRMTITWQDGHASTFELALLRKHCPCAACREERQHLSTELSPVLKTDPGADLPRAVGARLAGNYAVQIDWSDGHDTGIYDYEYLRALDAGEK